MILEPTEIPDVLLIKRMRFEDTRGVFSEIYRQDEFERHGIHVRFVQDNHSHTKRAGTLRGLHYQRPPHAQDKLVSVLRGRVLDVAVDLRMDSPTFGMSVAVELSERNGLQLFIPKGFAHGFLTLEPDTEVIYKVSDHYAPHAEAGIRWDDPDLAIDWTLKEAPLLSVRDGQLPRLTEIGKTGF